MQRINVTQSSMPDFEEFCNEIKPLWKSKWLTNFGELHHLLQSRLQEFLEVENVMLFANGHMALEAALAALDLKGEVITTPFTFASTTQAIVKNGLTPVFCDVREDDFTIDSARIEQLITPKTSAIVAVHVYGNICNIKEIDSIAEKYHLKVIYDAAHAFGETVEGKTVGTFGDASMFSFHATKVFNTVEGGCVTYADHCLTESLSALQNFGMKSPEDVVAIAGNGKMNEFQAAMGICNLRCVENEIAKRKAAAKRYQDNLGGLSSVKIWKEQSGVKHNYAYFPVIFNGVSRERVLKILEDNNICARKYFYPLTSSFRCYQGRFEIQNTPIAKRAAERVLALPLYADLPLSEIDRICELIRNAEA